MIRGIGIDLVETERIRKIFSSRKKRERIFSDREIAYCERFGAGKWMHYAARFAVKEAVFKAFSVPKYDFRRIEVMNIRNGKPVMRLKEKVLVSLTHTDKYACAVAIWTTSPLRGRGGERGI